MQSPKQVTASPTSPALLVSPPEPKAVRAELEKILAWEPFQRSERLSRFLRYTVEQVLGNAAPQLKEYVIAMEVFDKPNTFDPRLDPIVRVEARRLRTRIREYYETEGRAHPVHIRYGPRGYRPVFEQPSERSGEDAPAGTARIDEPPAAEAEPGTIAVLPFVDLSPQGEQQRLCDSLTEELINAMGRFGALRVASRTSTRRYQGKSFDIREAGRELGVDMVLEGSIRQDASRIRIAAQLYGVSDGLEIWSRAYERPFVDAFAIVADIAQAIAESLRIGFTNGARAHPESERQESRRPPANAHAYRLYLRGLQYWRDSDDPRSAVASLERSIEEEPDFGPAYGELALAHAFLAWFKEARPAEAWPKAEAAAAEAVQRDPRHAVGHTIAAASLALFRWDWRAAELGFLRALECAPGESAAHEWYATTCLAPLGRLEEAVRQIEQAQAIDPHSPLVHCRAGLIHFYRGEADQARGLFLASLDLEKEFWPALWNLGRLLLEEENFGAAEQVLSRAHKAAHGSAIVAGHLGYCHARQGKTERAREILAELQQRSRTRYVSPLHQARIHIALGETGEAVAKIEAARQHRCTRLAEVAVDPIYKPLRQDERFAGIVGGIGLPVPQEWQLSRAGRGGSG